MAWSLLNVHQKFGCFQWRSAAAAISRYLSLRQTLSRQIQSRRYSPRPPIVTPASTASTSRRHFPLGLDNVEHVEEYRPGGYHPVHLGDVLDGRYKILHKLGAGGFSTTWVARDLVDETYRALKILKAEETASSTELRTLQRLAAIPSDQPGRNMRTLTAHFVVQGPNGQHDCLVTEVAGPSLHDLYNVSGHGYTAGARRLRSDMAHKIIRQLVEAVHLLHTHKICHGDLTLSNVLLALQPMDSWTETDLYARFGRPKTVAVVPVPNTDSHGSAPRYLVQPADMPDPKFLTMDAQLVDFGESFDFAQPPKPEDIGIPFQYRAPETLFESKISAQSESWSLACVLFEIRAGKPLLTSIMGGADEIIQQMVQMKGRLPHPWWQSWEKRSICFGEDGKPHRIWPNGIPLAVEYSLDEMIADIGSEDDDAAMFGPEVSILEAKDTRVPGEEAEMMRDLFAGVLRWEPEERGSVAQILRHPWVAQ